MIHIGGPTHRLQEFLGWGRLVHLHSAVGQCPIGPSSGLTGAPWRPSLPHTALGKGARLSVEVWNRGGGGARRLGASLVRWLPQPPSPMFSSSDSTAPHFASLDRLCLALLRAAMPPSVWHRAPMSSFLSWEDRRSMSSQDQQVRRRQATPHSSAFAWPF